MKGELTTSLGRQSISIRDGAGALFRRKGLILLTFLTVIVGTVIVTAILPNRYESRMKILVKNQRVDVAITPEATTGNPGVMASGEVSETQINSEIELLTSKDLLTDVVKQCNLAAPAPGWLSRTPAPEAVRIVKFLLLVHVRARELYVVEGSLLRAVFPNRVRETPAARKVFSSHKLFRSTAAVRYSLRAALLPVRGTIFL